MLIVTFLPHLNHLKLIGFTYYIYVFIYRSRQNKKKINQEVFSCYKIRTCLFITVTGHTDVEGFKVTHCCWVSLRNGETIICFSLCKFIKCVGKHLFTLVCQILFFILKLVYLIDTIFKVDTKLVSKFILIFLIT